MFLSCLQFEMQKLYFCNWGQSARRARVYTPNFQHIKKVVTPGMTWSDYILLTTKWLFE